MGCLIIFLMIFPDNSRDAYPTTSLITPSWFLSTMLHGEVIAKAEEIEGLLRAGYSEEQIRGRLGCSDELLSIARARIRNKRSGKLDHALLFNEQDLRFATHRLVAAYRAERLQCKTILDLGCGIGMQATALAKTCKGVISVEIDKRKLEYARINASISGAANIEFIEGDALTALNKIRDADVIFWDPERPACEDERSIDSFKPEFSRLMEKAVRLTRKIAIELPPQMQSDAALRQYRDFELEYISINNALNRLTAYLGRLRGCAVSAVALPSAARLEYDRGDDSRKSQIESVTKPREHLYEIDAAVAKAGLTCILADKISEGKGGVYGFNMGNKLYFTSDGLVESPFLRHYRVIASVPMQQLKATLRGSGIGKAILRGRLAQGDYWRIRSEIENGLSGEMTAHVFIDGDRAVIAVKAGYEQ